MPSISTLASFSFWLCGGPQRELQRAIKNARKIGKVHQFIELGHLYKAMGEGGHALAAYYQALSREPDNAEALWESATIELSNRNIEQATVLLRQLAALPNHWREQVAN